MLFQKQQKFVRESMGTVFDHALVRTKDFHFFHSRTEIETWSAEKLLFLARACAQLLLSKGVRQGSKVAICLPTSPELVACIIAAWGCGAAVVVLPSADKASNSEPRLSKLYRILDLIKPQLLVHTNQQLDFFSETVCERLSQSDIREANGKFTYCYEFPSHPHAQDLALIQLTSGSTGLPKGVLLSHGQIAANCAALQERAAMSNLDHVVSWLPTSHDMGFNVITLSIWANSTLTLIQPEQFVRSPMVWLQAISTQRGTLSATPAFAIPLIAKYSSRLKPLEIDLNTWRYAWVGAEPVFDKHLKAFNHSLYPFGLRDSVLKPSFGMAEAVVAITCNAPGVPYLALHIDADLFRRAKEVQTMPIANDNTLTFVSNGPALNGMAVRIVDERGADIGEFFEGRLQISGASVTKGYLNNVDSEQFTKDGWFDTGDLGFVVDGELYISGRAKDLIIRAGVNVSPQHIEWAIEQNLQLRAGQVAAFSVIDPDSAKETVVVIIVKRFEATIAQELKLQLTRAVISVVGVQIDHIIFSNGVKLPKTTSGKLQRSLARQMYLNNEFSEIALQTV